MLWRDTAFLAGLGVMDYSLLVGLDSHTHRLVIGIIDFIRQVNMLPSSCLLLAGVCRSGPAQDWVDDFCNAHAGSKAVRHDIIA